MEGVLEDEDELENQREIMEEDATTNNGNEAELDAFCDHNEISINIKNPAKEGEYKLDADVEDSGGEDAGDLDQDSDADSTEGIEDNT